MKPNIKTTQAFYHNLGKLFYAIAFSDKKVSPEEFKVLQEYVESYWLPYDDLTDIFGSDAAHLMEVVFEGVHFLMKVQTICTMLSLLIKMNNRIYIMIK
ncbi:hypothetical protein JCM19297_804 [Nonlabens ulvanivorans]|nr:hypothetical protein [Nonlabens ulvanivorans]GAK91307.1 hypothetical protein JCM19297_804 [Nonlabens ulvanivorans]